MAIEQISSIMTSVGPVRLTSKEEFFQMLPKQLVDCSTVTYTNQSKECITVNIDTENKARIPYDPRLSTKQHFSMEQRIRDVQNALFSQTLNFQLMKYIVNKKVDLFVKSLTVDTVQDLTQKIYNSTTMVNDLVSFPIFLSQYQKFFLIIPSNIFNIFYTKPALYDHVDRADRFMVLKSKLIDMYPNKDSWVMCQFDECKLYDSLNSRIPSSYYTTSRSL